MLLAVAVLVYTSSVSANPSTCPVVAPATAGTLPGKPTKPEAIRRFETGNRAYKSALARTGPRAEVERELERALAEYRAGQAVEDAIAFEYNAAQAFKALGRAEDAVAHLQRFIDCAPLDPSMRATVEKRLATLDPNGAIRAELAKRSAAESPTTATPLPPVPGATLSPPSSVAPSPRSSPDGLSVAADTSATSSISWRRVAGWGIAGLGVIGAGVTSWLVVDARQLDSQALDASVNRTAAQRNELADRASARRRSSIVFGIGSGALIATGLVLALWPGDQPHVPQRGAWHLGITSHGVAVSGRF